MRADGHDPHRIATDASRAPYDGEAWVWDDDGNGDDIMIAYKEEDEDGAVQVFLDIPGEDRYFWSKKESDWLREGDEMYLPSHSLIVRQSERDEREANEARLKDHGEQQQEEEWQDNDDMAMDEDEPSQQQEADEPEVIDNLQPPSRRHLRLRGSVRERTC